MSKVFEGNFPNILGSITYELAVKTMGQKIELVISF